MFSDTKYELSQRQKRIDHDNAMSEMMDYYDQLEEEGTADDIAAECYRLDRVRVTHLEGVLFEVVE